MVARFNKHVPMLCADCGKPLSVAEKRIAGLCTWDAYMLYRKELEQANPIEGAFWVSTPSDPDGYGVDWDDYDWETE